MVSGEEVRDRVLKTVEGRGEKEKYNEIEKREIETERKCTT